MAEEKTWTKTLAAYVLNHLLPVALVGVVLFLLWLRFAPTPPPPPTAPGPVTQAPVPAKAQHAMANRKVEKGPPKIAYVDKYELAGKLKMPELKFINDNVIAVGEVAPHKGKTTVIATLGPNADNVWEGGILLRQEPRSFFEMKKEFRAGLYYVPVGPNMMEAEVAVRPFRVWDLESTAKVRGALERDGGVNGSILLGVEY